MIPMVRASDSGQSDLVLIQRDVNGVLTQRIVLPVRFVPLV